MIGNSHIDPVWFWNWEEGMQEVKATFASALDRMKEYEEFKFTSTSTAFFEWIEKTVPAMFEEIKERVAEGRWEITGGWFIEPDCNLPCGEAFVRQGLYSQRYLLEKFGKLCTIGSNVDSFGHGPNLPQLLKKSGIEHYVFMRPRRENPVFLWESEDGSSVNAISLPGEYTTWFYEPTKKNIEDTLAAIGQYDALPCCYGVGNHGGGPTKENIECVRSLQSEYPDTELVFDGFEAFFQELNGWKLEVVKQPFEKYNEGCYAMDSELKRMNRLSESRLMGADMLLSMTAGRTGLWPEEFDRMKKLWKLLLFNQFHDTLGGTAIKEARDEAILQLSAVSAGCKEVKTIAMQAMVNHTDTTGEGFPLFLFHTGGQEYRGYVTVELNWFCKHPLKLLDPLGNEVAYQRVHTAAKVRNYNLGGRRAIVFEAQLPACGYAMYRLLIEEPSLCYNNEMELDREESFWMENDYIKVAFDRTSGLLNAILDKSTGYNSLKDSVSYQIWKDERDTWGHLQERPYGYTKENMKLKSLEKVESGAIRECIRAIYEHGASRLEQLFYLYAGDREIVVENRLHWDKPWHEFKLGFPLGIAQPLTKAEGSYCTITRRIMDEDQYYMHRFLEVESKAHQGLAIANDSRYSFSMKDGTLLLVAARSAIYAQGNGKDWYCPQESYEYTDLGELKFQLVLRPHGEELPVPELYRMANRIHNAYDYLADSCHTGTEKNTIFSLASTDQSGVEIMTVKKAEEDEDFIVRILETEGKDQSYHLYLLDLDFTLAIGHHELQTYKVNRKHKSIHQVNLLEFE